MKKYLFSYETSYKIICNISVKPLEPWQSKGKRPKPLIR